RLTCRRRSPSRSSAILLVVEGALRRVGRVLRLLQALLEFAVEELALLPLGLDALAEALLDLGRARAKLVERSAQIRDGARRRRWLVRDHGPELRVQRELGLTARALDGEGRVCHGPTVTAPPRTVKQRCAVCCCYMKMSGGNCSVKRSSPYGDLHVEPKGTASPRAAQSPLCRPGDHT